jgi:O-succinylbenzoate synthase
MAAPTFSEIQSTARVVSIPLRTRFRGLLEREALVFEGPNGWTEWAPFVEYNDAEAAVWLRAAIEFGYGALPEMHRTSVPVNATLPAVAADQVEAALARFGQFKTVKIKVAEPGQDLNADLERVWAVRAAYPEASIRLDSNGGYSVRDAFAVAVAMIENGVPLEYLEQPVATLIEMIELREMLADKQLDVKVAADELVRKATDPLEVAGAGAADILVLKVAPLGGINRSLAIAAEAGLPAVVSSALDSSIGLSMGAHLAGALPDLEFDCGLGTAALLAGDLTNEPLKPIDGAIDVRRVEVSSAKLDIHAAEDHRADWWFDRLERVLANGLL